MVEKIIVTSGAVNLEHSCVNNC